MLKRSGRELIENSRDDTTWVKVQLQELSNRWDTVCKLSVSKQTRLEQALKQVSRKLRVEMVSESFAGLQVCTERSIPTSDKDGFAQGLISRPSRSPQPCSSNQ